MWGFLLKHKTCHAWSLICNASAERFWLDLNNLFWKEMMSAKQTVVNVNGFPLIVKQICEMSFLCRWCNLVCHCSYPQAATSFLFLQILHNSRIIQTYEVSSTLVVQCFIAQEIDNDTNATCKSVKLGFLRSKACKWCFCWGSTQVSYEVTLTKMWEFI